MTVIELYDQLSWFVHSDEASSRLKLKNLKIALLQYFFSSNKRCDVANASQQVVVQYVQVYRVRGGTKVSSCFVIFPNAYYVCVVFAKLFSLAFCRLIHSSWMPQRSSAFRSNDKTLRVELVINIKTKSCPKTFLVFVSVVYNTPKKSFFWKN